MEGKGAAGHDWYVTIHSIVEIGRFCGMEMNVNKTKVMRISRQPSPVRQETTGECGIFQLFG